MATLKVHAGDFPVCNATLSFMLGVCSVSFPWQPGDGFSLGQSLGLSADNVDELVLASEESVKRLGGTLGWGAVGATLLGPAGLLAGLIAGGRGKNVTFALRLKDGRRMLATSDAATFTKLQALIF